MGLSQSKNVYGYPTVNCTGIKLAAQKNTDIYGSSDIWNSWKSRTECYLDGSGYEEVIYSRSFSDENERENRVVYSQLAVATINGMDYHSVKPYEDTKYGHGSWGALEEWYDGVSQREEVAKKRCHELEDLKLYQGSNVQMYINKFLTGVKEIERIPREGFSASHVTNILLDGIRDPDYAGIILILQNQNETLQE